ncbi:citryl-CoA lyase [Ramlibacter sp.]|uniref:citryl-CoA lyase n=1 Tax=Ramlibacter sp. TaxID=1917967 RepID=UPI003D0CD9AF
MSKTPWRTAIADFDKDHIRIAGYAIGDLMRNLDFGGSLFVLMQQRIPSAAEAKIVNAILVSVLDHGIVAPSVAARVVAASGVPIQACVAAGIMTIGDVHGGAGQELARRLIDWVKEAKQEGIELPEQARRIVAAARERKKYVEGFGHPLHPRIDERTDTTLAMAHELGVAGPHVQLVELIAAEIEKQTGRSIPVNVDGAMASVLMDLGFDWRAVRMFVFVPRAAGVSAHVVEEQMRERGWRVVADETDTHYDGPAPRAYPSGTQG